MESPGISTLARKILQLYSQGCFLVSLKAIF